MNLFCDLEREDPPALGMYSLAFHLPGSHLKIKTGGDTVLLVDSIMSFGGKE